MTEPNVPSTPPNSQRAPDTLSTENELICEKLLGWRRLCHNDVTWWEPPSTGKFQPTMLAALSFETWDEAGMILDQFESRAPEERVDSVNYKSAAGEQMKKLGILLSRGQLRPLDIRAAGLDYVRSLP